MTTPRKVALIILDGWGLAGNAENNAIATASTPTLDQWFANYPAVGLQAAGLAVGLPEKNPGSSEAGHRALGTGQVTDLVVSQISADIQSGSFWRLPLLEEAFVQAKAAGKKVHLVGLLSDVSNHASLELLYALIDSAKQFGYVNRLHLHLFLDGRDTQVRGGQQLLEKVYVYLRNQGYGTIATICGRQYAMVRDGHADYLKKATNLLVKGEGAVSKSPLEAVMDSYGKGESDATLEPTVCDPAGLLETGDTVIFFNHRADRMRPLVAQLGDSLSGCRVISTIPYQVPWAYEALYQPPVVEPNLCSVLSAAGQKVVKVGETDRYAHLTYFFNGGREEPYYNEERVFIDTPDARLTPEQGLHQLSRRVSTYLRQAADDLLVIHVPNLDACGHTGDMALTQQAVTAVDAVLADWLVAANDQWLFLVTSDHGNAEYMLDLQTKEPRAEDTANPVPCLMVHSSLQGKGAVGSYQALAEQPVVGMLTDVPTTILAALQQAVPASLGGINLLDQIA